MDFGTLDSEVGKIQNLLGGAGSAFATALDTVKVFKPEIDRLDQTCKLMQDQIVVIDGSITNIKTTVESNDSAIVKRLAEVERRLAAVDNFMAALPIWKEEISNRIEVVSKDSKIKTDELNQKQKLVEESLNQSMVVTRERLDTLTSLARSGTEARQAQSERIEVVEKNHKDLELLHDRRITEVDLIVRRHEEDIAANARQMGEVSVLVNVAGVDIQSLRSRTAHLEQSESEIRGSILGLSDRLDGSDGSIGLLRKQLMALETVRDGLVKRLDVLEKDTRVKRLQDFTDELNIKIDRHHERIGISETSVADFQKILEALDKKVDKGPPGLWKISEQVAAQAVELEKARAQMKESQRSVATLERSLEETLAKLQEQGEVQKMLLQDAQDLSSKLTTGLQRVMKYADSTIGETVQRHELESLKASWVVAKRELAEQLEGMTPKIKFELFAAEGSQAKDLKDYMQTVEASLARNQEKISWLEEAVHLERERGLQIDKAVEKAIDKTREDLKGLVLEGELDVAALKKELVAATHQHAEMQRMVLRGEIVSSSQVEALVAGLLQSESFDQAVSRKIHSRGPLSDLLSSLASKHEVEALRKFVLEHKGEPQGAVVSAAGEPGGDLSIVSLFKRSAALEEAVVRTEQAGLALEAKLNSVIASGGMSSGASHATTSPFAPQADSLQIKQITSRLDVIEAQFDLFASSMANPAAPATPSAQALGVTFARNVGAKPGRLEDGAADLGTIAGSRRFPTHPNLGAQISVEGVNAEIAGLVYDMAHLSHEELIVMKDGPLPGSSGQGPTAASIREAALQRLRGKPAECQKHVELLEKAKGTLNRFFSSTAHSTLDWLSLSTLMVDMRLKLLEDYSDIQKDQIAKVYVNLEQAFDYLRKLQDAVNSKASSNAVHGLEKVLGAMAHEMLLLGPSSELNGRDGVLAGSRLSTPEFWASLLSTRSQVAPNPLLSTSPLPPAAPAERTPNLLKSSQGPLQPSSPSGFKASPSSSSPSVQMTAAQRSRAASARTSPMTGVRKDVPALMVPLGQGQGQGQGTSIASALFISSPRDSSLRFASPKQSL